MYLILSGELLIIKGNKQIATLGPGQYLGEMSLIESKARSASAKATQDTLLLEINETQFNKYLASEPQALLSMMRTLSSRIRNDLENTVKEMRKLSIFTHDIKNNLTPLGLAEMGLEEVIKKLKGTETDHQTREGLEDVEEAFEVITNVKDNMMTMLEASLNQIKKNKVEYIKTETEIIPVIEDTIQGLSCHKNVTGKNISVECGGEIPKVVCNPLDIKRVLQNLLINAGCVTEDGGGIRVVLEIKEGSLLISVIDTGGGIPKEIQPFLLKESLTTKEDGNGLGLLSCKAIVEDHHHGKFWFDTAVGQGTAFRFTLPLS